MSDYYNDELQIVESDGEKFIDELSIDQPLVAKELSNKASTWIQKIDKFSGKAGLGNAILNNLEYIGSGETEGFINSVVSEVKLIREKNPDQDIKFIMWSTKSMSGKYFYDRVLEGLTTEEKSRVGVVIPPDVNDIVGKGRLPVYFHLDDSSNSGQQLMQSVTAMRSLSEQIDRRNSLAEKIKTKFGFNKVDFRIRLLRVTDSVLDEIFNPNYGQLKYMQKNIQVDISGNPMANKKMKTMDDVFKALNVSEGDIQNAHYFLTSHHERRPATLGIFKHKFQDNMPMVLVEGRVETGFDPLFTRQMMDMFVSPYLHN